MTIKARRPTRAVQVGSLSIGGDGPILIQSMTTSDTVAIEAVVEEIATLARSGCPLVRITVPHLKAAECLPAIRAGMEDRGIGIPLVADIHFTPSAALASADHVEKVRINPGNYADRKRFELRAYSDEEYAAELERVREEFIPLVRRLKERGVALRIGTNHGSLSDRILGRYGDTPLGMVESALEFVRICRDLDFHEIVLSMKSSIPLVMIAANRLLVQRMEAEGMDYPIHLGVTEAGSGLEGRIKSAIGIGALLMEGIGDTIRVSLTEDSVHEIAACRDLLEAVERQRAPDPLPWVAPGLPPDARRATRAAELRGLKVGGGAPVRVEARLATDPWRGGVDAAIDEAFQALQPQDRSAPLAVAEILSLEVPEQSSAEAMESFHDRVRSRHPLVPLWLEWDMRIPGEIHRMEPLLRWTDGIGVRIPPARRMGAERIGILARLATRRGKPIRFRLDPADPDGPAAAAMVARSCADQGMREISFQVAGRGIAVAAREIARELDGDAATAGAAIFLELPEETMEAAAVAGSALVDGIGDGLIVAPQHTARAYSILQGCRLRLTRAEFIACPSCGRTQFDLQTTTRRIQEETAHLSGVKIAIMGCIVNGPGEMADADFGYVGSAPGKIDLYVGKERVRQAIPENEAVARLIDLIRAHGMWIEPPEGAK